MQETIQSVYDCSAAILRGVEDGVLSTIDDICHPYDNIICPISSLLFDATVIVIAHANVPTGSEIDQRLINPYIYQNSMARMHERMQNLRQSSILFGLCSYEKKVEIISSMLTTVLVPGAFMKAFKGAVTLNRVGVANAPVFRATQLWSEETLMPVKLLSPAEVYAFDKTAGQGHLIYVILETGELRIAPTKMPQEILRREVTLSGKVEVYPSDLVGHRDVAQLKNVYMAGEIEVSNGKIIQINNESGCYTPQAANPDALIRNTFVNHGYGDVANPEITRISNFYDPNFKSTNIVKDSILFKSVFIGGIQLIAHVTETAMLRCFAELQQTNLFSKNPHPPKPTLAQFTENFNLQLAQACIQMSPKLAPSFTQPQILSNPILAPQPANSYQTSTSMSNGANESSHRDMSTRDTSRYSSSGGYAGEVSVSFANGNTTSFPVCRGSDGSISYSNCNSNSYSGGGGGGGNGGGDACITM